MCVCKGAALTLWLGVCVCPALMFWGVCVCVGPALTLWAAHTNSAPPRREAASSPARSRQGRGDAVRKEHEWEGQREAVQRPGRGDGKGQQRPISFSLCCPLRLQKLLPDVRGAADAHQLLREAADGAQHPADHQQGRWEDRGCQAQGPRQSHLCDQPGPPSGELDVPVRWSTPGSRFHSPWQLWPGGLGSRCHCPWSQGPGRGSW